MNSLINDEQALALRLEHLPLPADAIDCESWYRHDGEWRRFFLTQEWEVAGLWVSVAGEQNHRGHVTRWLRVGGEDRCTSSDREQLIAALIEAGKLLDSLNDAACLVQCEGRHAGSADLGRDAPRA